MTLELLLKAHAEQPLAALPEDVLERWAAIAKLAIAEHAWRAVSNSLQVMGDTAIWRTRAWPDACGMSPPCAFSTGRPTGSGCVTPSDLFSE
jgi:alkylation response protein AidB-like acyl-CoA dehydrogenase